MGPMNQTTSTSTRRPTHQMAAPNRPCSSKASPSDDAPVGLHLPRMAFIKRRQTDLCRWAGHAPCSRVDVGARRREPPPGARAVGRTWEGAAKARSWSSSCSCPAPPPSPLPPCEKMSCRSMVHQGESSLVRPSPDRSDHNSSRRDKKARRSSLRADGTTAALSVQYRDAAVVSAVAC